MMTRDDFERWYRTHSNLPSEFKLFKDAEGNYVADTVHDEYEAWQACAAHYEAEIAELIEDLQDLRIQTNYRCADVQRLEAERNALLALIAEKDEALRVAVQNDRMREALALTHENVRLVALEGKYFQLEHGYVRAEKLHENEKDAIKLYAIEVES